MFRKVGRALWMTSSLACSAVVSLPLLVRRYVLRRPVVGSIPFEMRLHERYWERRLRADTGGWAPATVNDGKLYEGTPYLLLFTIMMQLDLGPEDRFVDLGCGKGRVVAMAALSNAGSVAGVEQDETFLAVARENIARLPGAGGRIQLVHGLAQQFDFDAVTVVFMFNPFGERTVAQVLDLLGESLRRSPRRLRIVYANPVHEAVLQATAWLENTTTWPSDAYPDHTFLPANPRMVSFWEARPERLDS
ncbi:MAG: class I SAM-dependent methyltransferase [Steroidobacteraceae bacterium]